MKNHIKIITVFLSLNILCVSFFQYSFVSYASSGVDFNGNLLNEIIDKIIFTGSYVLTQGAAVKNADFRQFMQNYVDSLGGNPWLEENIIIDEANRTVTFSEDLTSSIKQALKEYSEETDNFKIYETVNYDSIPYESFSSSAAYETFRNLVEESEVLAAEYKVKNDNIGDLQDQWSGEPFDYTATVQFVEEWELSAGNEIHTYIYDIYNTLDAPVCAYVDYIHSPKELSFHFLKLNANGSVGDLLMFYNFTSKTVYSNGEINQNISEGRSYSVSRSNYPVMTYSANFPVFQSRGEASAYLLGEFKLDETPDGIYDILAFQPFEQLPVSLVADTTYDSSALVSFYDTDTNERLSFHAREFNCSNDTAYSSFDSGLLYSGEHTSALIGQLSGEVESLAENNYVLFSTDGRRMKVYNSLNDFLNSGSRSVYFGSGFYDNTGPVKVSFDELLKYLDGKYDSFFDDLKKLLGDKESSMTESEIEKAVDKILDEVKDIGDSVDDSNNWLKKIYNRLGDMMQQISEGFKKSSAGQGLTEVVDSISSLGTMLEQYLSTIVFDLDYIIYKLEEMSEEEFNDKTDSVLSQSVDAFSEIKGVAEKKFPLSIPNDLRNLLAVVQSSSNISPAAHVPGTDGVGGSGVGGLISVESGHGGGGSRVSTTGAPVFIMPISVPSVGWEYSIVVDLSGFQVVSNLSRSMFTLIFAVGLINLTIKVAALWGDLIG